MSARQVPGLALDPRTKILIWLLANVVVIVGNYLASKFFIFKK